LSESARQAAASVDTARARGEKLGPLGGVPVTIKECFDLAGTASTFGLTTRRDEIESKDDPYVAALRAAGAIPIAKTNLPQLMIFTETDNPLYGRTNNPWDLERSCGGSSGGEAAVIAAGASPLGLGNDIGGSLRVPAARNRFDPANRRPHARLLRSWPAGWPDRDRQPGRSNGEVRRRSGRRPART
jgi:fatty acid amide hydrolase